MNDPVMRNDEPLDAPGAQRGQPDEGGDDSDDHAASTAPPMQTEFDDPVDEASADSFPASDPPPWTLGAD